MSKTVLLPDELHKKIQDTKINVCGTYQDMGIAKKIKIFFDYYLSDQEGIDELNKQDNYKISKMIRDAYYKGKDADISLSIK